MSTQKLQETLRSLREQYARELPQRIAEVVELWQLLTESWTSLKAKELAYHLHRIAGTAGSFGFSDVGDIARQLDQQLTSLYEKNTLPDNNVIGQLAIDMNKFISMANDNVQTEAKPSIATESEHISKNLVYIVDDDPTITNFLEFSLGQHGYKIITFNKINGLLSTIRQSPPALIIMDITLAEGALAGPRVVLEIQKHASQKIPVIFISARQDMKARLAAVRANGDAYLTKPINLPKLMKKAAELTQYEGKSSYRVLLVDDVGEQADEYGKILKEAGVYIRFLKKPMQIMEALNKFKPSLVLINTQLKELSGLELAMVIRQQEKYTKLPLIFYAQQFDQTLRRAIMRGLGDDFITDSISSEQLVSTVTNRIKQIENRDTVELARHRDNLTHLYDRQYLLAQLELSTKQVHVFHPFAILYISLDNYHGIKKIMGLAAIDVIIKDTAELLKNIVDPADLLSRFSDNVFVVLCFNKDLGAIQALGNSICVQVADRVNQTDEQMLLSTCSIGISLHNNQIDSTEETLLKADLACSIALENGGNCVYLHDSVKDLQKEEKRLLHWQHNLRQALDEDKLFLVYQPIATLHGQIRPFYDVLLRMVSDQEQSGVLATELLSIAEKTGLTAELDQWVIQQSIHILSQRYQNEQGVNFFIRLSISILSEPSVMITLQNALKHSSIPSRALIFDLPYQEVNIALKETQRFVERIKQLGCRLALSGVEGSATAYQILHLFPIDFIKLSKDTIDTLKEDKQNISMIQDIVKQGHQQNCLVIAPFVEDAESLSLLWHSGIDYISGYFVQAPSVDLDYDFYE